MVIVQRLTIRVRRSSYEINNCTCGLDVGVRHKDGRIIGGVVGAEAEFPWLVALFKDNRFYCAGTLINEKYVLTAAHSFKHYLKKKKIIQVIDTSTITILLGSSSLDLKLRKKNNIPFILNTIKYVRIHPEYKPGKVLFDISLIRMQHDIQIFSRTIFPICLPYSPEDTFENMEAIIAGWGYVSKNSGVVKDARKADVTVLTSRECDGKLPLHFYTEVMICAAKRGKDTCNGDSGGPLMIKFKKSQYMIIGVTSFGLYECDNYERPSVYTKVSEMVPWMKTQTEDATYCKY